MVDSQIRGVGTAHRQIQRRLDLLVGSAHPTRAVFLRDINRRSYFKSIVTFWTFPVNLNGTS